MTFVSQNLAKPIVVCSFSSCQTYNILKINENTILAHKDHFKDLSSLKNDLSKLPISQGLVNVNWEDLSNTHESMDNIIVYKQIGYDRNNVINKPDAILYAFHVNTEWLINKCIQEVENNSEFIKPFIYQKSEKYYPLKGS